MIWIIPSFTILILFVCWLLFRTSWRGHMTEGKRAFYERNFDRAEAHFVNALTKSNRFKPEDPRHAMTLNNLAELYRVQRKLELAKPLFKRALEIKMNNFGPEHEEVAVSLNNLALLQYDQSNFEEAENGFVKAIHVIEKNLGPEHPKLANVLENYAGLLRKMNRRIKAEEMEARAKVIWATPKLDVSE